MKRSAAFLANSDRCVNGQRSMLFLAHCSLEEIWSSATCDVTLFTSHAWVISQSCFWSVLLTQLQLHYVSACCKCICKSFNSFYCQAYFICWRSWCFVGINSSGNLYDAKLNDKFIVVNSKRRRKLKQQQCKSLESSRNSHSNLSQKMTLMKWMYRQPTVRI